MLPQTLRLQFRYFIHILFFCYLGSLFVSPAGMEFFFWGLFFSLSAWVFWESSQVEQAPVVIPPFTLPILLFTGVYLLEIFIGGGDPADKWANLTKLRFFGVYLTLFLYLRNLDRFSIRYLPFLAAASSLLGFLLVLWRFFPDMVFALPTPSSTNGISTPFILGFQDMRDVYASACLPISCLLLGAGISHQSGSSWFVLSALFSLGVALVFAGNPVWVICLPAAAMIVFSGRTVRGGMAAAGLALALFLVLSHGSLSTNPVAQSVWQKRNMASLRADWKDISADWKLFRRHPWLGQSHGLGRSLAGSPPQLHPATQLSYLSTNPFRLIVDNGILGFAAYLLLWVTIFSSLAISLQLLPRIRMHYWLARGLFAALVVFHIQGWFDPQFGQNLATDHMLMFLLALVAILAGANSVLPEPAFGLADEPTPSRE